MSRKVDFINQMAVFATAQHLIVITVLSIWVNTNAGKMCSGDTRSINDPRASTGSEGRPLPSC